MSTLRERLQTKAPRRIVQPVQLTPPDAVETTLVLDITNALVAPIPDDETPEQATERIRLAEERMARLEQLRADRYVEIPFVAMDSKLWEKIVALHPSPEGADGGMNWRDALPEVAALCCDDDSMQDDDAWREVLDAGDGWSHGELLGLWGALLSINTDHPGTHLPKG